MAKANEAAARLVLGMAAKALDEMAGGMRSSAALCLDDAEAWFGKGEHDNAVRRAIDSLRYSMGVFSPVLAAAKAAVGAAS
jgi:hypothetical protein